MLARVCLACFYNLLKWIDHNFKKNSKIKCIIDLPSLAKDPKGIAKLQLDIMKAPMTKKSLLQIQ
jgi:hypothetical protein